jgi:hypothetical protein
MVTLSPELAMVILDSNRVTHLTKLVRLMSCCCLVLLAACAEKSSLTIAEKTRFVSELIAERSECNGYFQKLSVPAKNNEALNELYKAAQAAHCLKPDV